jgi:hypothetical protein
LENTCKNIYLISQINNFKRNFPPFTEK